MSTIKECSKKLKFQFFFKYFHKTAGVFSEDKLKKSSTNKKKHIVNDEKALMKFLEPRAFVVHRPS